MSLYHQSGVCIESWVELRQDVDMKYEINLPTADVTLFFGAHSEYMMCLSRQNLSQFLELGARAAAELASASPDAD